MEFNYIAWSAVNWAAFIMLAIYLITTLLSAILDAVGMNELSTKIYFKGLSLFFWPALVVVITRWLGLNTGFFPE